MIHTSHAPSLLGRGRRLPGLLVAAALSVATVAFGSPASASVPSAIPAAAGNVTPLTIAPNAWEPTWTLNPYTANYPGDVLGSFIFMPLASPSWPSLTKYIPQLASHWKSTGDTFTVTLRPHLTWQNGQPLTSRDVLDTIVLDGAALNGVWNDISDAKTNGPRQILLTRRKGIPLVALEADLFSGVAPYPSSEYGRFVTPGLEATVISYFNAAQTDATAAQNSAAYKTLNTLHTNLEKFVPKTLVGDGPYTLQSITTAEIKLTKSATFFDRSHISVPAINISNVTSQQQLYPWLLTGLVQFSNAILYLPPSIVSRWDKTPDAHTLIVPGTFQYQVAFNDHEFPYNKVAVRQALAYLVPRKEIMAGTYGSVHPHAVNAVKPDGLVDAVQKAFLTKKQINSLNGYAYSPTKAARLLRSAGLKKVNGTWLLPDGKPFKLTFTTWAGHSDFITSADLIVKRFDSFGIKATETAIDPTTIVSDEQKGAFQLTQFCCIGGSPNPLVDFSSSPIGASDNFTSSSARGIGLGPVEVVAGLGRVNIPQTLTQEAHNVGFGPKMRQLTWDWARYVNHQMPFLQIGSFTDQIVYSTKSYRDWPPHNNVAWRVNGGDPTQMLTLAQEEGYIHPKE